MNNFKRNMRWMIYAQLVLILLCNGILWRHYSDTTSDRLYRVEAKRVAKVLEDKKIEDIDLSEYETIVKVSRFDKHQICNHDYVVEEVNGDLYRIEYQQKPEIKKIFLLVNLFMLLMMALSVIVMEYLQIKIVRPFENMTATTVALAKGNLAVPLKQEKSSLFGSFLWGIDMLRNHLEEAKEKELSLQREKKTLILSLSHDMKTPLSAIELYAKALDTNLYQDPDRQKNAIQGIQKNISEIKNYVDEITFASREEFLDFNVNEEEFYLSQVINGIGTFYQDKLKLLHTKFQINNYEDCLVKGDLDRLMEVVQNIIENAIKYGDGDSITISSFDEEEHRLIQVKNTGCSLKQEESLHIFDSFYRGSNSEGIKGSGLGLYISRNLMKKMGGEIFVEIENQNFQVSLVIRKV